MLSCRRGYVHSSRCVKYWTTYLFWYTRTPILKQKNLQRVDFTFLCKEQNIIRSLLNTVFQLESNWMKYVIYEYILCIFLDIRVQFVSWLSASSVLQKTCTQMIFRSFFFCWIYTYVRQTFSISLFLHFSLQYLEYDHLWAEGVMYPLKKVVVQWVF